jgi:hypothetical protein
VAHKDSRIRYRPAELQAVHSASLRMLCLTSGNLRASEQVDYFRNNLTTIHNQWDAPGPWLLAIRKNDAELLSLGGASVTAAKGQRKNN